MSIVPNAPFQEAGRRKVAAVIVAAGRGERAGSADGPKQFRHIGGRAVIARTIDQFLGHDGTDGVVVVLHPDDGDLFRAAYSHQSARMHLVEGGPTRQESTFLGLLALQDFGPDVVLIHDGVRPFVDVAVIDRVVGAVDGLSGAIPAIPVSDTLKRTASGGLIASTVSRADLHAAQTPQGFPYDAILDAHRRAAAVGRHDFTDDSAIAEWAGLPVRVVLGAPENVKLTWARDIAMADARLGGEEATFPDVRTGNGYDVHAFEPGDHVTLCGVAIPYDRQLAGHSDADVGLHALTDALLATCGEGDIGTHFPPSDPQWKGAASKLFLEHAAGIVRARAGRIANVDVTLICEAPRIGPHRAAMTATIAQVLHVSADRVSIKATTNEKLGFIGREEGIAAIANATVIFPGQVPE